MADTVKWPLGLKSLGELGLPVQHLGRESFVERYPDPGHLKQIAINRGGRDLEVRTETGFRATVPPMHKLMQDARTQVYSLWSIEE